MRITELEGPLTEAQADRLAAVFAEAFDTPPSGTFLDRLNEKRDLLVLMAEENERLLGFKIGYTRFRGVFFSWLGAVCVQRRRRGIGRALLLRQHELCVERGYDEIQTEAAGSNQ